MFYHCPEQRCTVEPMESKEEEGMEDPSGLEEFQVPRAFLNVLYDPSRSIYFLDFLEEVGSAPKLLFWLEVEQIKSTPGLNNSRLTTLEKFIVNDGALLESEIGLPHEVVEFTIQLWVKGEIPAAVVFSIAQALVKYELLVVWYPRFQDSPSYAALVDYLCSTYPLNLSQLLTENQVVRSTDADDVSNQAKQGEDQGRLLQKFLSSEHEIVSPKVLWALKIWKVIVTVLRPLCASVYKALSERGSEQSGQSLSHLIDELTSFKDMVLEQGAGLDPDIRRVLKRIQLLEAAAKPHPVSGVRLGVDVINGAVNMVSEGLLRAQQQANHLLMAKLLPAVRSSGAFVEFVVEEGLSNQCIPLQAYLHVLTEMQGNRTRQRVVYFPRMVAPDGNDVGGSYYFRTSYLSGRPSLNSPSPYGYLLEMGNLRLDLFIVAGEGNAMGTLENPESITSMIKKEGSTIDPLSTPLSPHVVLCFSVWTQQRKIGTAAEPPDINVSTGGPYRVVYKEEEIHDNEDYRVSVDSVVNNTKEMKNIEDYNFETKVLQLNHIYLARVVRKLKDHQPENLPSLAHIQNPEASTGRGILSSEPTVIPSYLGSGMFPTDTGNNAEKQKEMGDELQEIFVSTSLLKQLPGYCLPSAIAILETQPEHTIGNRRNSSIPESLRPSIHHFVLTTFPKPSLGEEEEEEYCRSRFQYDAKGVHTLYGACRTEWRRSSHSSAEEGLPESAYVWLPHCTVMVTEYPLVDSMDQMLVAYLKEDQDQSPHCVLPSNSSGGTASSSNGVFLQEEGTQQQQQQEQQQQQQPASLTLIADTQGNIPLKWSFPSSPIPALDYSIYMIFRLLSPEHVLAILQWLALERSVLVTSSNRSVVFYSCEAFRALLHPLKWQYRFAPFLPPSEICSFATSGLSQQKDSDLASPVEPLNSSHSSVSKRPSKLSMDDDPFLVGVESSFLSLAVEWDDIQLRMGGKGCDEVFVPGHNNAAGSLCPVFGVGPYKNNNSIGIDLSSSNDADGNFDENATWPSEDTLYWMWHLASKSLIVDLDFDELTPPSIIGKRNDTKQASSSALPLSFPPPPLSDPESLWLPVALINSTLQSIQDALFAEIKTFDAVQCQKPTGIGIHSSEEDDLSMISPEKESEALKQRLRQVRLNEGLPPGPEEYIIKGHTRSATDRALRGAVLEMWQSLLGDMKLFLSPDWGLGICRLDSEIYLSLRGEKLTRRGCSLVSGLFGTQALTCLLRDELLYSIPPSFARNALAKWKTAVDLG